jgi:hypothetical protein
MPVKKRRADSVIESALRFFVLCYCLITFCEVIPCGVINVN